MRDYSQADLDAIAAELNGRPRQTLGFETPSDRRHERMFTTLPVDRSRRTTLGGMSTDDREPVLAQAVAERLMAGVPLMGGTLALTATRLVFLPLVSQAGLGISNKVAKLSERAHRQLDQQWTRSATSTPS